MSLHRDADLDIAVLEQGWRDPVGFGTDDQNERAVETGRPQAVRGFFGGGCCAVSQLLQRLQAVWQRGNLKKLQVVDGAGGCASDVWCDGSLPGDSDDDTIGCDCIAAAEDGAKVVRVLQLIAQHKQSLSPAAGGVASSGQQSVLIGVRKGAHTSEEPLVIGLMTELQQAVCGNGLQGQMLPCCQCGNLPPIGFRQFGGCQQFEDRPAGGSKSLEDGVTSPEPAALMAAGIVCTGTSFAAAARLSAQGSSFRRGIPAMRSAEPDRSAGR